MRWRGCSPARSAPISATRPDPTGHAAARIAAKEAVYKAMQSLPGARAIGWREIEVTRDPEGRPAIRLHGLAERLAEEVGGVKIQVSLTHSRLSAGAVAVVSAPLGGEGKCALPDHLPHPLDQDVRRERLLHERAGRPETARSVISSSV